MIIGITGHRDLKEECVSHYEDQINSLLIDLKKEDTNIVIYSSLADGADRMVVKEGIKLDIPFIVVLPMLKDKYQIDFDDTSLKEFKSLLYQSQEIITIPLSEDNTLDEISSYSSQRDTQYEAVGQYIAENCDSLIALWDGKYINLVGGTGEIVKYYLTKQDHVLNHLLVSRN